MAHGWKLLIGITVFLALIVAPVHFAIQQQGAMRNFRVVREGVLYRSGQMTLPALKRVVQERSIRAIVCLRDSNVSGKSAAAELAEEEYCKQAGLLYVRIPPRAWEGPDGTAPVDEGVRTFLEVMADSHNYPVLVHCFAGVHRTGAYVAIYRMEHEGWTNEQAIEEMKTCGYFNIEETWDLLGYMERYRPGRVWNPQMAATTKPAAKKTQKKKPTEPDASAR